MDIEQGGVGGNRHSLRTAVYDEMSYGPKQLANILIMVSGQA
jgi:hypothetical protein